MILPRTVYLTKTVAKGTHENRCKAMILPRTVKKDDSASNCIPNACTTLTCKISYLSACEHLHMIKSGPLEKHLATPALNEAVYPDSSICSFSHATSAIIDKFEWLKRVRKHLSRLPAVKLARRISPNSIWSNCFSNHFVFAVQQNLLEKNSRYHIFNFVLFFFERSCLP